MLSIPPWGLASNFVAFFHIAVAEFHVFPLLLFFTTAQVRDSVEYVHVFEGVTAPSGSGVLLKMLVGMQAFVVDVGLFSVPECSQFAFKTSYLAYHRGLDMEWEDKVSLGWFSYIRSSGDMLDISAVR